MSIDSYNNGGTDVCGRRIVPFIENACYDVKQTARIINRSVEYVRSACARGDIRARRERAGFMISGWQLRKFIEGRSDLEP